MISVMQQIQAGMRDQVPSGNSFDRHRLGLISLLSLAVLAANWLRFLLLGPMGAIGLGLRSAGPTSVSS